MKTYDMANNLLKQTLQDMIICSKEIHGYHTIHRETIFRLDLNMSIWHQLRLRFKYGVKFRRDVFVLCLKYIGELSFVYYRVAEEDGLADFQVWKSENGYIIKDIKSNAIEAAKEARRI